MGNDGGQNDDEDDPNLSKKIHLKGIIDFSWFFCLSKTIHIDDNRPDVVHGRVENDCFPRHTSDERSRRHDSRWIVHQ